MPRALDELKKEALALEESDRVQLVAHSLDSLPEFTSDPEIEEAWANEINRRHSDYKSGLSVPVAADIVFEEIEKTFGQL